MSSLMLWVATIVFAIVAAEANAQSTNAQPPLPDLDAALYKCGREDRESACKILVGKQFWVSGTVSVCKKPYADCFYVFEIKKGTIESIRMGNHYTRCKKPDTGCFYLLRHQTITIDAIRRKKGVPGGELSVTAEDGRKGYLSWIVNITSVNLVELDAAHERQLQSKIDQVDRICIASSAEKLPSVPGISITASRGLPLQKEEERKKEPGTVARQIEIDTITAGQPVTYIFRCDASVTETFTVSLGRR